MRYRYAHRIIYESEHQTIPMSKQPPNDWQKLWDDYTKSFETWKQMFESIQKAGAEMQANFNRVIEKAAKESSSDTMKQFGDNWKKAMSTADMDAFKQFGDGWQKAINESTTDAYKQFAENWQKSLTSSGMDQLKSYGDMMGKFAETWNLMWPKR